MYEILIFLSLSTAILSFFLCYYAHVRITKILNATKDLDWSALSNITGDLATLKKTIQTLNNRLNGMHSPRVADEEIMRYMANKQVSAQQQANGKIIGG
jgi:hypothetical protein